MAYSFPCRTGVGSSPSRFVSWVSSRRLCLISSSTRWSNFSRFSSMRILAASSCSETIFSARSSVRSARGALTVLDSQFIESQLADFVVHAIDANHLNCLLRRSGQIATASSGSPGNPDADAQSRFRAVAN